MRSIYIITGKNHQFFIIFISFPAKQYFEKNTWIYFSKTATKLKEYFENIIREFSHDLSLIVCGSIDVVHSGVL